MPEENITIDETITHEERMLNFIISSGGIVNTIQIRRYGLENGILQADRRVRCLRQNYPNGFDKFGYPDICLDSRDINPTEMNQWGIKCKRIAVYFIKPVEAQPITNEGVQLNLPESVKMGNTVA